MRYEDPQTDTEIGLSDARVATVAPLPSGVALTDHTVGELRAYLEDRGLTDYRIFHCAAHDLHDIDQHLAALGEPAARWEPHAADDATESLALLTRSDRTASTWPGGFLRLAKFHVVLARWFWMAKNNAVTCQWLIAAPSADPYVRLHRELESRRHAGGAAVWQVIRGAPYADGEPTPRGRRNGEDLLLGDAVRSRIDLEVIRFFDPEVADLYREMGVPYRRGVLLHGPPGNGKTSTIRHIGASLPNVPAMILRPAADFDSDDLETALDRWRRQAPALLVIEDLNWLLKAVNVSTFLNLLDGVDSNVTGGLLLIATTNHPEMLDPAINNRPGRFDVVIEVPCPNRGLRAEFFRRKWAGADEAAIDRLATATGEMSFAHLQEILRVAGLLAIQAGRRGRTIDDMLRAAGVMQGTQEDAARGFAARPEAPFGLAAWRRQRGEPEHRDHR